MPARQIVLGEAGRNVARNVELLRRGRGLSFKALSVLLAAYGRPILPSGLYKIGAGTRRVDADDLVAIAAVFRVKPADLLTDHDWEFVPLPVDRT